MSTFPFSSSMLIRDAKQSDMRAINETALRYDLDSNDMSAEQFIVAEEDACPATGGGKIIGFGRLVKHADAAELGTIGVVEEYRNKGIATTIIKTLLGRTDSDVYLTTLIPSLFEKFGFKKLDAAPPESMIRTAEWCEGCTKIGCTLMKKRCRDNS